MKKVRRFLQTLLFINFMVGMGNGMKAGNLVAIILNGVAVIAVIANEDKTERK